MTALRRDLPLDLRGDTPPDTALPADGAIAPHDLLTVAGLLVTSAGIRLAAARRRSRH